MDRTPVLYVAVDGVTAPVDLTRRVKKLRVEEEHGKATKIALELVDDDGQVRAGNLVREGQVLGVRWGFAGESLSLPRAGIVHALKPKYGDALVVVEALGRELALSRGRVRRSFRNRSFRQAVEELAREGGFTVDWRVVAGVQFEGQVLHNEHAWAWIQRHSAELGLEVVVEGTSVIVREPTHGDTPSHVLRWNWRGGEMLEFEPATHGHRARNTHEGAVALFFDPASGARLSHAAGDPNTTRASLAARRVRLQSQVSATAANATAAAGAQLAPGASSGAQGAAVEAARAQAAGAAPSEDSPLLVSLLDGVVTGQSAAGPTAAEPLAAPAAVAATPAAARQHVQQVAQGRFRAADRQSVRASTRCTGLPLLRLHQLVQVLGVEPRDGGLWRVHKAVHEIEQGYLTELELRRDGVNGRHHARQGASAQANDSANRTESTQATEPQVQVSLVDGRER